eukprot:UC4_evm3s118
MTRYTSLAMGKRKYVEATGWEKWRDPERGTCSKFTNEFGASNSNKNPNKKKKEKKRRRKDAMRETDLGDHKEGGSANDNVNVDIEMKKITRENNKNRDPKSSIEIDSFSQASQSSDDSEDGRATDKHNSKLYTTKNSEFSGTEKKMEEQCVMIEESGIGRRSGDILSIPEDNCSNATSESISGIKKIEKAQCVSVGKGGRKKALERVDVILDRSMKKRKPATAIERLRQGRGKGATFAKSHKVVRFKHNFDDMLVNAKFHLWFLWKGNEDPMLYTGGFLTLQSVINFRDRGVLYCEKYYTTHY